MATLNDYKRIIIKIGSALLVDGSTGNIRTDWLRGLAADVARLKSQGQDVIIVSSGSIALGRSVLRLTEKVSATTTAKRRPTVISYNQHGIAIGEKSIFFLDRQLVSFHDQIISSES